MKKVFPLLILFVATVLMAQAQDENDNSAWKTQLPRHDIQFGFSDPGLSGYVTDRYRPLIGWCNFYLDTRPCTWFTPDTYRSATHTTGTFHLAYTYRVAKWCAVGGMVSYVGFFDKTYDRVTNECVGFHDTHYFNLMPMARFSWFNRPCVTMYSGVSAGVAVAYDHNYLEAIDMYAALDDVGINIGLAAQATLFGVQAGRKWYGFAEVGIGTRSFLTAGFGYHFTCGKVEK